VKQPFSFTLEGREWSRLYLWYWIPSLLLMVLSLAIRNPAPGEDAVWGPLLLSLAVAFVQMMVQAFFTVPIYRTWFPHLSVDGKAPSFSGDSQDYVMLNVKGFLLSAVTLGVYLPWYARNVAAYLADQTSFDGERPRFTGRPVNLLLRSLAVFGVMLVVVLALVAGMVGLGLTRGTAPAGQLAVTAVTFVAILLVLGPWMYLIYHWFVQFSWKDRVVRWTTKLLPSAALIVGQFLLTVVTLGVWWPCAALILYRYFAGRTVVEESGVVRVRFSFDGTLGEGFLLLWGQALLTLVSLGFAGAWTGPRVARWMAAHTFSESL
jgi:uncharacterized membrane protein YjgN (DUF898 family)